jgi:hypothetical protein
VPQQGQSYKIRKSAKLVTHIGAATSCQGLLWRTDGRLHANVSQSLGGLGPRKQVSIEHEVAGVRDGQ